MKSGTIYRVYTTKTGINVTLRSPKWEDLDDLYNLHSKLILEEAMIGADTEVTRSQMVDLHAQLMREVETGKIVAIIAEAESRAVGQSNARKRGGRLKHNAGLGVFLHSEYRNLGIGTELMKELETQAKKQEVKNLYLEVFAISPAVKLYERLGYEEYGRLPKAIQYRGEYVDCISMYKNIK